MSLFSFKLITAVVILLISLTAGWISLRITQKHHDWLETGDAFASGIFLGVALFHLIPHAIEAFKAIPVTPAYTYSILLIITGFSLLLFLDNRMRKLAKPEGKSLNGWLLFALLSVHALIAGLTLGLSGTITLLAILFIAIVAHKGFETFALTINLYRYLLKPKLILLLFLIFSFITPLGILLGSLEAIAVSAYTDHVLTACFNAFAAGTFLYIGSMHQQHHLFRKKIDSYYQYTRFLWTLAGAAVMGVLALWV